MTGACVMARLEESHECTCSSWCGSIDAARRREGSSFIQRLQLHTDEDCPKRRLLAVLIKAQLDSPV